MGGLVAAAAAAAYCATAAAVPPPDAHTEIQLRSFFFSPFSQFPRSFPDLYPEIDLQRSRPVIEDLQHVQAQLPGTGDQICSAAGR